MYKYTYKSMNIRYNYTEEYDFINTFMIKKLI